MHAVALIAALATPAPCAVPNAPVTMDPLPPEIAAARLPEVRGTATVRIALDYQGDAHSYRVTRESDRRVFYTVLALTGPRHLFHPRLVDCVARDSTFTYDVRVDADAEPRFIGALGAGPRAARVVTVQREVTAQPDVVMFIPEFSAFRNESDAATARLGEQLRARGIRVTALPFGSRRLLALELANPNDLRQAVQRAQAAGAVQATVEYGLSESAAAADPGVAEAVRAAKDDATRYATAHAFPLPAERYVVSRTIAARGGASFRFVRGVAPTLPALAAAGSRALVTVTAYFP